METEKLVAFSEMLHKLADSHQDLFGNELAQFRRSHAIQSPEQLEQTFQAVQEQNRLMNIGIVGRVKAGKSSLLNALIFDGEPILPKAATPMTAALTTITWGEKFHAKVEYFSETDINIIKSKADQYQVRLEDLKQQFLDELIKRRQTQHPQGSSINIEELSSQATRQAQRKLQSDEGLFVAYDQYQRMQNTGTDSTRLHGHSEIQASTPKELAERLQDYVGAEGQYMPFTKTVHVFMPLEALRDIRVIDTPGLNDPVQSREERTVQLLKTCDVVFIVSPAGQFLNEQDLDVMGRITQKEGVQELVLIASQVDTQLYGSEKRARLSDALHSIREQLSARAHNTLTDLRKNNPEVGTVFDELINSVRSNLLHSSGLCHSLSRRFNTPSGWDSNEKTTWDNLTHEYPDYFGDDKKELSLQSLDSLANIAAIKQILAQVRDRKAAITQDKLANLAVSTRKSLQAFQQQLISLGRNQISLIKTADVKQLDMQLNQLKSKQSLLSSKLSHSFEVSMFQYRKELRNNMETVAKKQLEIATNAIEIKSEVKGEKESKQKGGLLNICAWALWGGGTKDIDTRKILTSPVVSALEFFLTNTQNLLRQSAEESRLTFDTKLSQSTTKVIREDFTDDIDANMVRDAIDAVIGSIKQHQVNLDIKLPKEVAHRGTLKYEEAETFKNDVDSFVGTLESQTINVISEFIDKLGQKNPVTIADSFVEAIQVKIDRLMAQIIQSAQTIEKLERFVRKSEEATL